MAVRLQSLRVTGFKSFCDETEILFSGNLCGIVGPNGCGKSNVVDAILWVLGEQSPSLLRLKAMGDVVFSGAAGRPPAGGADVTLRLASEDGRWLESGGQLELNRKVLRTGPSEYRMDGRTARLKDVMDELFGVGLGTRGYAIIEQGRVGQVLSARPTDRRILIEEAAGITRYRSRRRDSELQLEHTRQNLLRIDDVVSEVQRSERHLKKQARDAERHLHLEEELKDRLRRFLTLEAHALHSRRGDLARQRAQAQNEVAAAAAALASADADLAAARRSQDEARVQLEATRGEVSGLVTSCERLEAFLSRSADLLDTLRATLAKTNQEVVVVGAGRHELEQQAAEAAAKLEGRQAAQRQCEEQVTVAAGSEAEVRKRLQAAEKSTAENRQELLRVISGLTAGRNQLGELEREQDRLAYAASQLEQERGRLQSRRQEAVNRYDEASGASRTAAGAIDELEQARLRLAGERSSVAEAVAGAKLDGEKAGHAVWELRHRLAGVDAELARLAAVLDQLVEVLGEEAVQGQLSDYLHPDDEVAPLLDRVWREWLELPVVADAGLTADQREALAELEGRIRLAMAAQAPPFDEEPTPDGAVCLLDRAGVEAKHRPWIARCLPPAYLCEDADQARRLAEERPVALFLDPDGLLWSGRVLEPPTAGAKLRGHLALRADKEKLGRELESGTKKEQTSLKRQRELAAKGEELDARLGELSAKLVSLEQERAGASAVEQSLAQDLARIERELEALHAEGERHRKLKKSLGERRAKLEAEVGRFDAQSVELEGAVEEAGARVEALREEAAGALRRLDRWQAEARLAAERAAAATADVERLKGERAALEARLEGLQAEAKRLAGELEATEGEVVRSRGRLAEEQGMLAAGTERERKQATALERLTARAAKLEEEVLGRRRSHDEARETLHASDMERTKGDSDWERLRDSTASELGCLPEDLLTTEPEGGDAAIALRAEVEALRERLAKMGPVNPLALRELEELEQRAKFLGTQRTDLVESLRKLEETIREIDAVCMERFVATFAQVNQLFGETFTHLFGGGTARLEMVDEDDPLESGLDLVAQPPGKRTQSVQLLSGGEKALTALSLLIALFRIRPAPFCILDEVDAPLDDANVERFADLVQAMTVHTQFVVITHNRRTMARCDVLYGVTMEEPGVSKIVSVRLEG